MHRFFVEESQISENEIIITGLDVNHIKNVLRMKIDDKIMISSGKTKEYTCRIEEFSDDEVVTMIEEVAEVEVELKSKIYLFQGLPKSDKMELIIQKAVELGAFEIIPVTMKHCVVKLDSKKEATKLKRWQSIATSAAKQAKRMIIPKVTAVISFEQAVIQSKELDICIMPYEKAMDINDTKEFLKKIKAGQSIGVFIGAEGGFAKEEVALAEQNDVKTITLGKRILRTETAGLTTLSILMFLMEES